MTRAKDRQDIDRVIDDILGDGRRSSLGPGQGTTSSPLRRSRPTSGFDGRLSRTDSGERSQEAKEGSKEQTASVATQTLSLAPLSINYEFAPIVINEPLQKNISFKAPEPQFSPRRKQRTTSLSDSESDQSPSRKSKRRSRREREREEELRQNLRREIEEELKAVKEPASAGSAPAAQANYPGRPLTSEELDAVTSSEDFLDFVDRSSKVIEKALDQDYDVLADYGLDGLEGLNEEDDEGYASSKARKGRRIKEIAQFYDERWSKKRMISDLGFSPKVGHPLFPGKVGLKFYSSFLNFYWHHTPRIPPLHKTRLVLSKYGTCISIHAPNTHSTQHPTSSLLDSHHSTPR